MQRQVCWIWVGVGGGGGAWSQRGWWHKQRSTRALNITAALSITCLSGEIDLLGLLTWEVFVDVRWAVTCTHARRLEFIIVWAPQCRTQAASLNLPSSFDTFHYPSSHQWEMPQAGWKKRNQHGISLTFDLSLEQKVQFLNTTDVKWNDSQGQCVV